MNILFVTIAWPNTGERNLYSDLMNEFANNGHSIYVLYADEHVSETSYKVEDNLHVLRVNTSQIRKANKLKKAFSLFTVTNKLKRALENYWSDVNIDLIVGHSPPVTFSSLFKSLKKSCKAPLYYLLKDIWPQGPADLQIISKKGLIYQYFKFKEKQMYKTADYIGCMSQMNVDYLLKRHKFLNHSKVEVCPNSITPRNTELSESRAKVRGKFNIPQDATVFIFSGNLGKAHGLNFYINAIEKLNNYEKAYFLVGGSGLYYNYVVKEIKKRGLKNLGTYSRLPMEDFDNILLASDIGVILLDSRYTVPQFPSRLLAYLEAKKPVFCCVNKDTDIGNIVEKAECGLSTLHGNYDEFIKAVRFFCEENKNGTMDNMKGNSYQLLLNEYTTASSYNTIMKQFSN